MHCKQYERDIALYAGEDLPARRIAILERHLHECESCRVYADSMRSDLNVSRRARELGIDDTLRAELYRGVMNKIADMPRQTRMVSLAPAFSAVALLLVLSVAARVTAIPKDDSLVIRVDALAAKDPYAPATSPLPKQSHAADGPGTTVKLYCENPNVVFYLVSDNNGG